MWQNLGKFTTPSVFLRFLKTVQLESSNISREAIESLSHNIIVISIFYP